MTTCCSECFSSRDLVHKVHAYSTEHGFCTKCRNKDVPIIASSTLREVFQDLVDLYVASDDGAPLHEAISADWNIFALSAGTQQQLLREILGDGLALGKYQPRYGGNESAVTQWQQLREELRTTNRHFPANAPDRDQMAQLAGMLSRNRTQIPETFFRARIKTTSEPFRLEDLLPPPPHISSGGRANPFGIVYLYVADDLETAVAEVRPSKGDMVAHACFRLKEECNVVDLTSPRRTVSPFALDRDQLAIAHRSMKFLIMLGDELSSPAAPHRAQLDYLASQYLCELMKMLGYHGVMYKSSLGPGINYAFFYPNMLEPIGKVGEVTVDAVAVSFK